MTIGFHPAGGVAELVSLGVLVDPARECHERLRHAREIPTRMDAGLIRKAHAWPAHQRHRVEVLRIETQLTRQLGVGLQVLRLIARVLTERRVEVPVHPLEARVDIVLADDLVNLRDSGKTCVPDRLRVRPAESFHQVAEAGVGHHCQVRTGVSGVGRGTTTTFEHDDTFAGLREEVRGREASDPAAHDDHIGLGVVGELGILRERGRGPVWGGVTRCSRHRDPFQRPVSAYACSLL